jgi:hypothetical protein
MRTAVKKMFLVGVLPLALVLGPIAFAQEEEPEAPELVGQDRAIQAIQDSLARIEAHLTALLEQVPEQARAGIERALQANREGRLKALAALGVEATEDEGVAAAETSQETTPPEGKGPEDAQAAITDGRARAEQALTDARELVPEQAYQGIDRALAEVRRGTEEALAALKTLPVLPDRPDLPPTERPQSVTRPERPAPPDRPGR